MFFRPKSAKERGRTGQVVVSPPSSEKSATKTDHVWVQFLLHAASNNGDQHGATNQPKLISSKRLIPVLSSTTSSSPSSPSSKKTPASSNNTNAKTILVTPDTIPYRLLASSQVCESDHILEIGCSTGESSSILLRYGKSWVGFDRSEEMIEQCLALVQSSSQKWKSDGLPDTPPKSFYAAKMDAFANPTDAIKTANKFSGPDGPRVVFLDIGGNREEEGVLHMMQWVFNSFPNLRLLVIKSRELVSDIMTEAASSDEYSIHPTTGVMKAGSLWLERKVEQMKQNYVPPSHPLRAPLVYSPNDVSQPICRYHNYHSKGCGKELKCPYDHEHCHRCLQKGHKALTCKQALTPE